MGHTHWESCPTSVVSELGEGPCASPGEPASTGRHSVMLVPDVDFAVGDKQGSSNMKHLHLGRHHAALVCMFHMPVQANNNSVQFLAWQCKLKLSMKSTAR